MAEGKKAFIIYTNWKNYTDVMTNEQAGIWIKWCLDYCNDLEPEYPSDTTSKMLCVMCKDILKADLKKYEEKRERFKKIGKQYSNDTENETENGNREREPKTDSVISNKLIVNSNKLVCDKSHTNNACACEEEKISKLKKLLEDLQTLYGRCLTMMEQAQIEALSKNYDPQLIMDEIKNNLDKANPIAYISKKLQNKIKQDDDLEDNEWLKGFYERREQEERERK